MDGHLVWDIDPVLLSIGGFAVRYYSLCWLAAFAACYHVMRSIFRREALSAEHLDALLAYVFLGTFIGARLGHCLFYETHYYLAHPWRIVIPLYERADGSLGFGFMGLASHGAAIGIVVSLILYARRYRFPVWELLDKLGVVAPLGGAFIRLGNFFNSEIIGAPTDGPWGVVFSRVDPLPRHPAQLYEALGYFAAFAVTYVAYGRSRGKVGTGYFFGLSVLLIFGLRFAVEFVKEVQEPFEAYLRDSISLDMGQLLSIPFILTGAAVMAARRKRASARG